MGSEAWNNDAILDVGKQYQDEKVEEVVEDLEESKEALNQGLSDLDYLKSKGLKEDTAKTATPSTKFLGQEREKKLFFTVKLEGLPYSTKKKRCQGFRWAKYGG